MTRCIPSATARRGGDALFDPSERSIAERTYDVVKPLSVCRRSKLIYCLSNKLRLSSKQSTVIAICRRICRALTFNDGASIRPRYRSDTPKGRD